MRIIFALALAMLAGTLCAGTGGGQVATYQTVDCGPCQVQQVVQRQQYQTITINEPRIKWNPEVTYEPREIQLSVPEVKLSSFPSSVAPTVITQLAPQQTVSVPSGATQSMPVQVMQTAPVHYQTQLCPNGQCYQTVQTCPNGQCVPQNYVADSDRGTNVRFEPAMVITEDGDEQIIRTPIRSAIAARRLNRTSTFDKDPPGLFR